MTSQGMLESRPLAWGSQNKTISNKMIENLSKSFHMGTEKRSKSKSGKTKKKKPNDQVG